MPPGLVPTRTTNRCGTPNAISSGFTPSASTESRTMRRNSIVLVLVIILLIGRPAFARIGETETQIVARYGQSLPANATTMLGQPVKVFLTADLRVGVAFIDGKSAAEF